MLQAVSHTCSPLAKMTKNARRILDFARDHSGPVTTSLLMAKLAISRRTVERAHALLKRLGIAKVWQKLTPKGLRAWWSYDLDALDSRPSIDLEPDRQSAVGQGGAASGVQEGAAPRFTRGYAAAVARGLARARTSLSSTTTKGCSSSSGVVDQEGKVEGRSRFFTKAPAPEPTTADDGWTLAQAKQHTAAHGQSDPAKLGLLADENPIVDAYLTKLATRKQYISGRFLTQFRHLVQAWLLKTDDPSLVAQALQSILNDTDLAAYHTNTIETYGWQFILAGVRTVDCEALGLWKRAA